MRQIFLFLSLLTFELHAKVLRCNTEFGETVPLRMRAGKVESDWNAAVRNLPGKSQVKVREFAGGTLDTRYMTSDGPTFFLDLRCEKEKCQGGLRSAADGPELSELKLSPTKFFDQRLPQPESGMHLRLATREHFGLMVRITKQVPRASDLSSMPVSGSGDVFFFEVPKRLEFDVGADEHLVVPSKTNEFVRIAALEVKIRCQ